MSSIHLGDLFKLQRGNSSGTVCDDIVSCACAKLLNEVPARPKKHILGTHAAVNDHDTESKNRPNFPL